MATSIEHHPAVIGPAPLIPAHPLVTEISAYGGNALLAGLPNDVLQTITPRIDTLMLDNDQIVFAEDDPGDCLFLIAQGSVKISKRGRGGQQETLTYLPTNDYFGEMALVDSGKRSAQATAVGTTMLGRIDRATWDLLLHLAPQQILTNFTRSVTQRLRQNNQHFIEQMMRSERLSLLGTTISSIVHDMNNPITTLLGASQVILSREGDEITKQMGKLMLDAVERINVMARELLDYSRGDTQLKLALVNVPDLVQQLDPDFAKCRVAAEVEVQVDFARSLRIDRHRILRVFGNLIKNAREAMKSSERKHLRFFVQEVDDHVDFEVSDTGHGIKSEVLPKIFEPFVTSGKTNGTGLGLAISKAVVEAHGGSIAVQTSATGTTFRVSLPLPPKLEAA